MNPEQRIQITLGQLHFRIAVLESELEAAHKKVAELEEKSKQEPAQ